MSKLDLATVRACYAQCCDGDAFQWIELLRKTKPDLDESAAIMVYHSALQDARHAILSLLPPLLRSEIDPEAAAALSKGVSNV